MGLLPYAEQASQGSVLKQCCDACAEVYRNKKQYPSAKESPHVCIVRLVTCHMRYSVLHDVVALILCNCDRLCVMQN